MRQPRTILLASLWLVGCGGPGWQSALTSPVGAPAALTLDQPLPRPADTTIDVLALTHQLGGGVPAYVRALPSGVLQLRAYLGDDGRLYAFQVLDADTTALTARRAFYERRLGAPSYTDERGRVGFWISDRTQVFIEPVTIDGAHRLLTTVGHPVSGMVGVPRYITPELWRICQEESLTFCERRQDPATVP